LIKPTKAVPGPEESALVDKRRLPSTSVRKISLYPCSVFRSFRKVIRSAPEASSPELMLFKYTAWRKVLADIAAASLISSRYHSVMPFRFNSAIETSSFPIFFLTDAIPLRI
jgi:hypothetical protein